MGRFDGGRPLSESHTMPLTGAVLVVLGSLIVVFDYPQIEYLGGFGAGVQADAAAGHTDATQRDVHARLVTEFAVGVAVLAAGTAMCAPKAASSLRRRLR